MLKFEFVWNDDIVEHISEHGVSQDDFEDVVCNPSAKGYGRSSSLPVVWGYTPDGRYIMAVYEPLDELTDLVARDQMRKDARDEGTLSGVLRRSIHASDLSLAEIATRAGITAIMLDDFLTGERTLRSDILDRLADALGYELPKAK